MANHVIKPIDGLNLAAQNHDKAYDAANASAENINWGTVEADNALVSASKKISDLRKPGLLSDDGELDPYTNLPFNDNQYKTALNVQIWCNIQVASKIDEISRFMEANYPELSEDASHSIFRNDDEAGQERNYIIFRKLYMEINEDGRWTQDPEMWKYNDDGKYVPKSKAELNKKE